MNLFDKLSLRDVTLRNRIVVSPMCQYSAIDGVPNDWHLVHLGSRAVGGAGLVITEASAVEARGRISPGDAGIYSEAQTAAWARINDFIHLNGAHAGIQLAHAGRKASTAAPWTRLGPIGADQGGWTPVVGPSSIPFQEGWQTPVELSIAEIESTVQLFAQAAERSFAAGFDVIEIHAAHGYLLHQFLSPLSNQRKDEYGGSFENRTRFLSEVVTAVRSVWPERLPLLVRLSATDYAEGGWDIEQTIQLSRGLKSLGVDLVDMSSGGNVSGVHIPLKPGYQVQFAERVRAEAGIAIGAVGLITEPKHAQEIVESGQADVVLLARELLRDPYWPRRAAKELGVAIEAPEQYGRAW